MSMRAVPLILINGARWLVCEGHVVVADAKLTAMHGCFLQVLIYQALGFQEPTFGHVSLILAPDKSKLSKRHGATSVGEFRAQGYLPEAMINYLSLLGWNDGTEQAG